MVFPFWVIQGRHFAHSHRNRPVGLVNVVNGSVGTVSSRHHTGHRGKPAIVMSHNGRYLVSLQFTGICILVLKIRPNRICGIFPQVSTGHNE